MYQAIKGLPALSVPHEEALGRYLTGPFIVVEQGQILGGGTVGTLITSIDNGPVMVVDCWAVADLKPDHWNDVPGIEIVHTDAPIRATLDRTAARLGAMAENDKSRALLAGMEKGFTSAADVMAKHLVNLTIKLTTGQ